MLVAIERRGAPLSLIEAFTREPLVISAITASELLHGVHRADTPIRRLRRERLVQALLAALPVIPFDLTVARTHAALWAQLATTGTPIGPHDLLIAATALARGTGVLTMNARAFSRVPELRVVTPPIPAGSATR